MIARYTVGINNERRAEMTNTTHTPGPWTFDGYRHINYASYSIKSHDRKGICAIASSIKRPGEESEANARLIAAAPELLAALEAMLEGWETGRGYTDRENQIGRARAAIAKATK